MGAVYNSANIVDLKYRWGSCTPKNNLHFNWRLIKAPLRVIEYVIVHELAHLLEPNHTQLFWQIVKTQVPDYERSKAWLKENGTLLEEAP
jgi:predicted metal-dependent hydrolase